MAPLLNRRAAIRTFVALLASGFSAPLFAETSQDQGMKPSADSPGRPDCPPGKKKALTRKLRRLERDKKKKGADAAAIDQQIQDVQNNLANCP